MDVQTNTSLSSSSFCRRGISEVQQLMCEDGYNVTVEDNFQLKLIPGTSVAIVSILLNIFVFSSFKYFRTYSISHSSSRSLIHFSILAIIDILVGIAFVISQFHAMGYQSYDDLYLDYAKNTLCGKNKTHHLDVLFSVFETSHECGRQIKGYSLLRYLFELLDRFANAYIAVDRTLIVCLPLTYGLRKQRVSAKCTYREFTSWVILPPVVFTFILVLILAVEREIQCIYELYTFLVIVLEIPILPVIICALILLVKSIATRGRAPPQIQEGLCNMTNVTLVLALVFLVCDVPNVVFQVGLQAGHKYICNAASPSYFIFNNLQHVARMISCFFHFFIYFAMSENFRASFFSVLRCCFCSDNVHYVINDQARFADDGVADHSIWKEDGSRKTADVNPNVD